MKSMLILPRTQSSSQTISNPAKTPHTLLPTFITFIQDTSTCTAKQLSMVHCREKSPSKSRNSIEHCRENGGSRVSWRSIVHWREIGDGSKVDILLSWRGMSFPSKGAFSIFLRLASWIRCSAVEKPTNLWVSDLNHVSPKKHARSLKYSFFAMF